MVKAGLKMIMGVIAKMVALEGRAHGIDVITHSNAKLAAPVDEPT